MLVTALMRVIKYRMLSMVGWLQTKLQCEFLRKIEDNFPAVSQTI